MKSQLSSTYFFDFKKNRREKKRKEGRRRVEKKRGNAKERHKKKKGKVAVFSRPRGDTRQFAYG
jgi:hypothetical protein